MKRKITYAIARFGQAGMNDLRAALYLLVGLALAGAPLALWHLTTHHLYRDVADHLPLATVLATLTLATALSAYILRRLHRLLVSCRVC